MGNYFNLRKFASMNDNISYDDMWEYKGYKCGYYEEIEESKRYPMVDIEAPDGEMHHPYFTNRNISRANVNKYVDGLIEKKKKENSGAWSMHSETTSWDYDEDRHGNVTIKAPDGRTCFLQGDDAQDLLRQIEGADKYIGNAQRYAWTIDTILSAYDDVCE